MQIDSDLIQTIAIIFALIITGVELRRTRTSNRINAYNSIIAMMNDLRNFRIKDPELERALFKTREGWSDAEIKRHVYAVELANIFEWVLLSRKAGLIDKSVWNEWIFLWNTVILTDEFMKEKLNDPIIYTFSHLEAYHEIKKMSENKGYEPPDPYVRLLKELFYPKILK